MALTKEEFSESVESLWWESAHFEICNMLLYFSSVQPHWAPDGVDIELLKSGNFKNMFEAWSEIHDEFIG